MVKRYLNLIPLEEAKAIISNEFAVRARKRTVPLPESPGKITASPVFSRYSVPMVHLSAMDGIAVKTADTKGASERNPVTITDAARVNTGNVVGPGYDAVIMIEDVREESNGYVIRKAAAKWQNIRPVGEDIGESEMIVHSFHRIRPSDIGALASYGITEVDVIDVRAGIIPTGSELIEYGDTLKAGSVIDSNSLMAAAMLEDAGAGYRRYGIVKDEPEEIRRAVEKGVRENDFLLISAGSSAGTRDFTADIISELGELLVHGISIKPAKPAIIGKIEGKPVIGLPGYPLAAWTIMREIVYPLLEKYGLQVPSPEILKAEISRTVHSPSGTDEFVLVSTAKIDGRYVAMPQSRGSGVQMSAVRANAYLKIPSASEGVEAGRQAEIRLLEDRKRIDKAFLITGSHDPCLDYIAEMAAAEGIQVHSSHVGSMGGILALKKKMCNAAPSHLLSEDGDYNIQYLKKYIPEAELALLCIADRQQGIVSRDGITFAELENHTYVNRQKGSGTRMLLDYMLKKEGSDASKIAGYDREMNTHLDIALAVRSGDAEAGMCTYSAAKALGLEFRPVATERYELIIPKETLKDERTLEIIRCVCSGKFKEILEELGGYDTKNTGTFRYT